MFPLPKANEPRRAPTRRRLRDDVMRLTSFWVVAACACLASGRTAEEKEQMQKAIRMKTTCVRCVPCLSVRCVITCVLCVHVCSCLCSRQLKEIFDELGIDHKGLSKEDLKKKAYKEDAIGRWEKLHPEKKRQIPKGGNSGMPDLGGDFGPGGKYEDIMRQMRGDFSHEKDPERRRILEKLAKKGMSFAGGNGQSTEELRKMEKMFDNINLGGFGKGAGAADDEVRDKSEMDADVAEEDKMEL